MGSCAKLWALEASSFQRLLAVPPPADGRDLYEAAEEVLTSWEFDRSVVVAMWRDCADNDLSRIAKGERSGLPEGADLSPLAPLLGIGGSCEPLPWWARALWPADANETGLAAPERVRAVRDALRASRLLVRLAPSLRGLEGFLDQAADSACWVLGFEGSS